jgi:hypothetical protein
VVVASENNDDDCDDHHANDYDDDVENFQHTRTAQLTDKIYLFILCFTKVNIETFFDNRNKVLYVNLESIMDANNIIELVLKEDQCDKPSVSVAHKLQESSLRIEQKEKRSFGKVW